jgi:hypothetical protein
LRQYQCFLPRGESSRRKRIKNQPIFRIEGFILRLTVFPEQIPRLEILGATICYIQGSHNLLGTEDTQYKIGALSNISPNLLAMLVFPAMYPPITSLTQQRTYTAIKSNANAPAIVPALLKDGKAKVTGLVS